MAQTLILGSNVELVCRMPGLSPLELMSETPNVPANGNDTVISPMPMIPIGAPAPAPVSTARQFGDVDSFFSHTASSAADRTPFTPEAYGLSQPEFDALPPDLQRMYRAGHNGVEYFRQLPQVRDSGLVEWMVRDFNNRLQPPRFMDMIVVTLADGTEILHGHVRVMRQLLGHEVMLQGDAALAAAPSPVALGSGVTSALKVPIWAEHSNPAKQAVIMEAYQDAMARLHREQWFQELDPSAREFVRNMFINDVRIDGSFAVELQVTADQGPRFNGLERRFASLQQRELQRRQVLSPEEAAWRAQMIDIINEGLGVPRVDAAVFVHENRDAIAELYPSWERLSPAEVATYRFGFAEYVLRNHEFVRQRQAAMAEARDPRRRERVEGRRGFEALDAARGRGAL